MSTRSPGSGTWRRSRFRRFGTDDYFRSETPDDVANVTGDWSPYFLPTSVGTSLLAVAAVVFGGWLLLAGPEAEG